MQPVRTRARPPPGSLHSTVRTISVICIILAALFLGISWWIRREVTLGEARLSEVSEITDAHETIHEYFESFPQAIDHGLLDLDVAEDHQVIRRLRILARMFDDDYLLEVNAHHRRLSRKSSAPGAFNLHCWSAADARSGWRARLLDLMNSENAEIHGLARKCIAQIAEKVPECLSPEPFPGFDHKFSRALVRGIFGPPPRPEPWMGTFLREALHRPAQLQIWKAGAGTTMENTLYVVLLFFRTSGQDILDEEHVRLLLDLRHHLHGNALKEWAVVVSRSGQPAATERVAELLGSGDLTPAGKVRALGALRRHARKSTAEQLERLPEDSFPSWIPIGETIRAIERKADGRLLETVSGAALLEDLVTLREDRTTGYDYRDGLIGLLESGDVAVRRAAVEALTVPQSADDPATTMNTLIGALDDGDFRVVHAAARALVTVTARWAPGVPVTAGAAPDPLPVKIAGDPDRFDRWKRWWSDQVPEPLETMFRSALESKAQVVTAHWRRSVGADGLQRLARAGCLDAAWLRRHRTRILERYPSYDRPTRWRILGLLDLLEAPWSDRWLWGKYSQAIRRDVAEAKEILETLARIHVRGSGDAAAILPVFLDEIGTRQDATAAPIHHYLVSRLGTDVVDNAIIERAGQPSTTDRPGLLRFFPASTNPGVERIGQLVELLADPDHVVRFWALEHLSVISGGKKFGLDPTIEPNDTQAVEATAKWKAWLERKPGTRRHQESVSRFGSPPAASDHRP